MQTNVFLNSYKKREDELTYAFFSMLEIMASKELLEFLSQKSLASDPLKNIKLLPVGLTTNPDGEILLTDNNNEEFKLLFENKTKIRKLDKNQIIGHLALCSADDKLLVVTPRKSDANIINDIDDSRIIFITWSEIATELYKNYSNNIIAQQFVEYGKISGQFEELGELTQYDVDIYTKYLKINFDNRLNTILSYFKDDFICHKYSIPFDKSDVELKDYGWGRNGIEIGRKKRESRSYGQCFFIGYYYNTSDHKIKLKKDVPEIAIFFDTLPGYKDKLKNDAEFCQMLSQLETVGFENNIFEKHTSSVWRLLFKRLPIDEFKILNPATLKEFVEKSFEHLLESGITQHKYFLELT